MSYILSAFSTLTLLVNHQEEHLACKKNQVMKCWRGYLSGVRRKCIWRMVQLMYCYPIMSCFIKIQFRLTFLVLAYPGCPGKEAVKRASVSILSVTAKASEVMNLEQYRHMYCIIYLNLLIS